MAYQINWLIEGSVIYFKPSVSADDPKELELITQTFITMLDQANRKVHLIIDDSEVYSPPKLRELKDVQSAFLHPNLGWLLAVGKGSPLLNFVSSTLGQLAGVPVQRCETLDAALKFLHEVDPTLPK